MTFSGDGVSSKPVTMEVTDTEANFSGTELLDAGAVVLASFLPKMTQLTSLDISNNAITSEEAVTRISAALKANTVLTVLNVSHNDCKLARTFGKVLETNM